MNSVTRYIDWVFCLVVLPAMIMIFPVERWFYNFTWYVVTVGIWLYGLYFLNRYVTVPCLFGSTRARVGGWTLFLGAFVVTYFLSRVSLYSPKPKAYDIPHVLPAVLQYQQALWTLFMIVEAFSFAVSLLTRANRQKARRMEVEALYNKAELELYKAQIKPHFMFNALNTIYGLFVTHSPNALPALERFISMMRYLYSHTASESATLGDEADYIRQYVGLQRLRLNGKTAVNLDIDIANNELPVPPLLLVTFVENCFKHGVSPVEESCISIVMHEHDGILEFATSNRIFHTERIGEHVGVDNCRRRLELLFPNRHSISITEDGLIHSVNLNIDLNS